MIIKFTKIFYTFYVTFVLRYKFTYLFIKAQHGTVSRPCEVSTDCGTGNYCAGNKRCACLSTYVEIDSYCWRSVLKKKIYN